MGEAQKKVGDRCDISVTFLGSGSRGSLSMQLTVICRLFHVLLQQASHVCMHEVVG